MKNQRSPRVTLLTRALTAARCRNRCSCSVDPKTRQRTVIRVDCPLHGRPAWMDRPRIPVRCDKGSDCPFCEGWMAEGNKPIAIETFANLRALDQIQQTLDLLWCQNPDVSATARMHMDLAATEVAGNIVQHAAGGQSVRMSMRAEVSGKDVFVGFVDEGRPAGIDLQSVGMPSEFDEHGRGLALSVEVLDELSYKRERQLNRWTLVRRRTP